MRKYIINLIICLIIPLYGSAQRSYWFTTDQVSSNRFQAICEDKYGFVWIGTENGLNRYDGYSFVSYFHNDKDSLSLLSNYVRTLYLDDEGLMWIGTNKGIQYQNPGERNFNTVHLSDKKTSFITQIIKLDNGQIWFTTSGRGVYVIYPDDKKIAHNINRLGDIIGTSVFRAIMEDNNGLVWLGTPFGISICDPKNMTVNSFKKDQLKSDINGIHEDKHGDVFISTSDHLYKWYRKEDRLERITPEEGIGEITHSFIDKNDDLYVTVRGNGLCVYNKRRNNLDVLHHDHGDLSLNRLDVSALLRDQHGNLWLGCFLNGLMMIANDDNQFKFWKFSDYKEDINGTVTALMVDTKENLWIGYNNNSLSCIDRHGKVKIRGKSQPYVNCFYQDKSEKIWVGLIRGGLATLNPEDGELTTVASNNYASIYSIVEDRQGRIYYSELGQGFSRYDKNSGETERWSTLASNEGVLQLTSDWIYSMYIDESNYLWIGHDYGMNCYDIEHDMFVNINNLNSALGNTGCYIIIEDSKKRLWLGTNKGLLMYDKNSGSSKMYSTFEGLSDATICGIVEDKNGNIWVSTQLGINKVNLETGSIDRYYSGAGLVDRSYSKVSTVNKKRGIIYFGSNVGITNFRPDEINTVTAVNNVILTGFYVNNSPITAESLSGGKPIVNSPVMNADVFRLAYLDNSFTLEFSTLNFGDQDCISFEYTFDQNKNTWSTTPAGVNRINFTHMGPGKHHLSVRARMNDSRSDISTYTIVIASPWYMSLTAYCIYVLILALIIWTLISASKRNREQELSEAKLQSFSNVAHEICTPMTMIISPLEELLSDPGLNYDTIKSLKQMHKSSTKILSLINQLLDLRKYDEGSMHLKFAKTELVTFIMGPFELFTQTAESRNIAFTFSHKIDELFAWIDKDSIDKVMMNLLSNAFKYTHDNGTIDVNIETGVDEKEYGPLRQYVEISVGDNGIGLNINDVMKVFDRFYRAQTELSSVTLGMGIGLNYCRILVEMHQGSIKAQNKPDGHGSVFSFRLPLGSSHIKQEDIIENSSDDRIDIEREQISQIYEDQSVRMYGTHKKILVIDDNDTMLDYIKENLQPMYKVITSKNGSEGLKQALSIIPDLVITDVIMPEMDGITLVKKLKNNSTVSHIPVIMLSGRNKLQDRMTGINNGADYYLPKPFYMNELKSITANLINNRLIVKGKFSGSQEQKDNIKDVKFQSSDELFMKRIMNIINANISNCDFNIEQLTSEVGLSRAQLHRKIKDKTGFSAGKFIQNLRMQQAANLLKEKKVNVTQIANAVGYYSHTHFSTSFKDYYGVTPLEYVKQVEINEHSEKDTNA